MRTTPLYGIPAFESSDRGRDLADIDWQRAKLLDAILANQGQPPLGSDLQTLLGRTVDSGWITVAKAGARVGDFTAQTDVAYRKAGAMVLLSGALFSSSAPSENIVFTLPGGFRPRSNVYVPTVLAWDAYVRVNAAGGVFIGANQARSTSPGFPLDGAAFPWTPA